MELRQRVFDALEYGNTTDCIEIAQKYTGNPKTLAECMTHLDNVFRIDKDGGVKREEVIVHANDWFRSKRGRKVANG